MPTSWSIVDSIGGSPTVRLNLNDQASGLMLAADPVLSPPEVRRVTVANMMDHGDRIPAAVYGNRVLTIPLRVGLATNDLAANKLQELAREMVRPGLRPGDPGNIIRTTVGSTAMFFRTYPIPDSQYDILLRTPNRGVVTLNIPCEPFGLGLKETLGPYTITNNPAAGGNAMLADITGVKGDVEAPASIVFSGGTGYGATGRLRGAVSIRRRGTVANTPFFLQAEAMTQGTDTTTQANSATFSGTGNNWSRCTFGTPTGQRRVYTATTFPTASTDARGTYRVFMRYRKTVASDSIDVQLQWGDSNAVLTGLIKTLPNNLQVQYVDLGTMRIPSGYDPVYDELTGVELAAEGTFISLFARRNSGSGNLDMDVFLFVPADDSLAFLDFPNLQAFTTDTFTLTGGRSPKAYGRNTSGQVKSVETMPIAGGAPYLTPNRTNRLFFVRDLGTGVAAAGASDSITSTSVLTLNYHPRYLFPLKPPTT